MFLSSIDKKDINLLPISHFPGEIILVDSMKGFNQVISDIKRQHLLGFDTESRPSFKRGVKNKLALLQLANSKKAWLLRLNKIGLPDELIEFLEDPEIEKVGVAIRDDLVKLKELKSFRPGGFIELADYTNRFDIMDNGLRKLAANILQVKISKSQQLSNWEAEKYSNSQLLYAATDAWACYRMYRRLKDVEASRN
jgi:ribonuclease D